MKTRLLILIIILSVVSYVVIVETDNYFNGGLTDNVSTPTSSDILSRSNSHSFLGDGNMTFYAEWCSQTEGVWVDSTCHFKNQEMFEKAKLVLDESKLEIIAETIANTPCNELLTGVYPEYEDVSYQRIFDEKVIECTTLTPFEWGFAFGEDLLGNYAEWCLDNNGFWNPKLLHCDFITEKDGEKANADLDARGISKVGGIKAQTICEIVDIPCPEDVEFTGAYLLHNGKTYIHQWKQQIHFTFYFDEDDPTLYYNVCDEKTFDCSEYELAKMD